MDTDLGAALMAGLIWREQEDLLCGVRGADRAVALARLADLPDQD